MSPRTCRLPSPARKKGPRDLMGPGRVSNLPAASSSTVFPWCLTRTERITHLLRPPRFRPATNPPHCGGIDGKSPTRPRTEPQPGLPTLRPRIKVWMQAPNGFGFGSRFIAILEAVDRTGSIKHAAADVGWSYRHVWSRIKRAEEALACTLVTTQ